MSWISRLRNVYAKLLSCLESIFQDLQFGLRMLLKNRVVTAAAIVSLSLAIGASTAAFSLLVALLPRTLPVPAPEQLVALTYPDPYGHAMEGTHFNYPFYERLREATGSQAELSGNLHGGALSSAIFDDSGNQEEKIRTERISGHVCKPLSRYLSTLLFEVKPSNVPSLALPLICLLAASGLAALAPALRAVRVDPMVALREE